MSADSNNPYAQMTGARQTMIAWARPVDSFEDLPEIYRDPVRELVENTNNIPYSVLAPAQGNPFNGKKFSEKVLFEIGDVLFILEKRDGQVLKTCLPYADVCSLEIGNILLFSWFEIKVRTQTGSIITSTVEYNETTLRYFAPFLQKMRPVTVESATLDMKFTDWQRVLDVDLNGTLHCCQAVLPQMIRQQSGRIVNVSSTIAKTPHPNAAPAYGAAKAGVNYLTQHLALEMSKQGIRVNAVCPGPIETDMSKQWSEEYRRQAVARIPLGRLGTTRDVANAVFFLASPLSDFITGETLNINGGTYMN